MRLQLIRYESVELTEQLMREKQHRQQEDDSGLEEGQSLEQEGSTEVQLRGMLLEEQSTEEPSSDGQSMLYVLAGDLSSVEDTTVLLQLPESSQQPGSQF